MSDPVDVVVVGGGISGLSNALALSRAGLSVRVLERRPAFEEQGAGLQLAPNATRILREWGLLGAVLDIGIRPRRLVLRDALDGQELTHVGTDDLQHRYDAPYLVLHRADLHRILLIACETSGVHLVTDTRVTSVEQPDRGSATAVSPDREDEGRLVLAADGAHSSLRRYIPGSGHPVPAGYVAFRAVTPARRLHPALTTIDEMTIHIGPGCHLVQYPLHRGDMINQVAVFRSVSGGMLPGELDEAFTGTCPPVRAAVDNIQRDRCWPLFQQPPMKTWVHGRIAITGDAAHAMLPYLAQGACQAMDDAHTLAGALDSDPDFWDTALHSWSSHRTRSLTLIQERVQAWGELWHLNGPDRDTRNLMLRNRDPDDFHHLDWLYS